MTATRQCPFTDCGKMIKPEIFACYPHWKAIPKELQAEVWRIYGLWQTGEMGSDELVTRQREIVREVEGR